MPASESVTQTLVAVKSGKLDALVVKKHGGRACRSLQVQSGDTLLVVSVSNWPKPPRSFQKVVICRNQSVVGEAVYNASRLRDLTRA